MSKCVLYERFADWRSTIPGIEHQRNKYCLSMFNSKGTPATIFASLAKAVLLTVTKGTYYNGYEAYDKDKVIMGSSKVGDKREITIVEYKKNDVTKHIACFDTSKHEFLFAGVTNDDGKTYEKYVRSNVKDQTVLWIALIDYLYDNSSEVKESIDVLDSFDIVKEMQELSANTRQEYSKEIQKRLFILCDAVYRRLGNDDISEVIPISIPSSGIFPSVPYVKTLKDLYSPTRTITIGEFTVEGLSKRNNRVNTTPKSTSSNELHCMYALNEHMSSDEKASVPTMPDWYVVPQWVLKAAHNIQFHHKNTVLDAAAKQNNIFLFGEPGSGKSEGAKAIASALGLPCTHISMSANSDEFTFTGQIIPEVDTNDVSENAVKGKFESIENMLEEFSLDPETAYLKLTGTEKENATLDDCMNAYANCRASKSGVSYKFVESDFCRAIENGWLVTIEEFTNVRDAGVGIILNQLMDGYQTITLPTGKVIHRHPNTVIVFASNVDEANCGEFETSTLSRLKPMYNISTPNKNELIQRVVKVTGCNDMTILSKMADVVVALRGYIKDHALVGTCGVREFAGWVLQYLANKDFDDNATLRDAAMETIVPTASPHEEDIEEITRDIIDTMVTD